MWIKEIHIGYFTTWSGLFSVFVRRYPPQSITMVRGHVNQIRMNLNMTQPPILTTPHPSQHKVEPQPIIGDPPHSRTLNLYSDCQPVMGNTTTNLPRRLPATSRQRTNYLLVLYNYNSNAILADPMRSRAVSKHLTTCQRSKKSSSTAASDYGCSVLKTKPRRH